MSTLVNKKSLKQLGQQVLTDYLADVQYLTRQTPEQLHLIKRAAVSQIAQQVPQTDQYKGLIDNVEEQDIIQIEKSEADAKAKWRFQLRKAASQITWKHWLWAVIISALITGGFSLLTKLITDSWPWWGYFLIGIVFFTLLGIGSLIVYNCRCGRKLEDQEAKKLEEESKLT